MQKYPKGQGLAVFFLNSDEIGAIMNVRNNIDNTNV